MSVKRLPNVDCVLALAVTAGVLAVQHEVVRKLADMTLVLADAAGFAELAAEHPLGCLDWVTRLLAATGLTWWGIPVLLAFVVLAQFLGWRATRNAPFAAWTPALLAVVSVTTLGSNVWTLQHPSFLTVHLFWYSVAAATCWMLGRRALIVWIALPLAVAAVGRWCWGDLAWSETVSAAFLPVPGLGTATITWAFFLCLAALLVFSGRKSLSDADGFRVSAVCRFAPAGVVLIAALVGFTTTDDCRDLLKMERLAIANDFAGVLKVTPKKPRPCRMETAWRLLALFRLDRLDYDLWRYPMIGSFHDVPGARMDTNGPDLLFQYGLVLPARRWTYEAASARGWRPGDYRLLGDAALVTGEVELAKKNFRRYARCPFRGDYATRRLAALTAPKPPDGAFADLADVAAIHNVWREPGRAATVPFGDNETSPERVAYGLFLTLQNAPPPMLKMFFVCSLLDGHPEVLRENTAALAQMYPGRTIGPVFLEVLR